MRIYIVGDVKNLEKFEEAEDFLRDLYREAEIVNPAKVNSFLPVGLRENMTIRLAQLSQCTHIYLIDGWKEDTSACIERGFAVARDIALVAGSEV